MNQEFIQTILSDSTEDSYHQDITDQEALEEFVVDNHDLEKLESIADQFNIFEAIGMRDQEIRHSSFLRFLLDPNESHGLGDIFLKRLLQKVLTEARSTSLPISLIDLDVWDLEDTTVLREWNSIDVLALNTTNKLAVIIENKIYSSEHSDQLNRYWNVVERNYADWRVIGLFLTTDGSPPSDERYLPVSYVVIANLIDTVITNRASALGTDIRILLTHYTEMLRRHIVSGSEIDELCLRLYKRHQRALDLIFERRPDRQKIIQEEIEKMVRNTEGFEVDKSTKTYISFVPKHWDVPDLMRGTQWSSLGRIMMFYFENRPEGLRLILQIGPGDAQTRERLFQMASSNTALFSPGKTLSQQYNRIYTKIVLSKKALTESDTVDVNNEIHKAWSGFINNDLPNIDRVMRDEGFF